MKQIELPGIGLVELKKHPQAKHYKIRINNRGVVKVTVPHRGSFLQAEVFVRSKTAWIKQQLSTIDPKPVFSDAKIKALRLEAKGYIPVRARVLAESVGLTFNKIYIKNMTSRWGSCSSARNLNFSLQLMELESKYIDYVIWHELAHLTEMNHGPRFWALLESYFPGAKKIDTEMRKFNRLVG